MKTKPNEAIVNIATEGSGGKKEVDFTKEWSNGHKMLNTDQVGALTEILHQEERIRERFEKIKGDMKRPRNPLNGEPTPRDVRGEVVMNPKQFTTIRNGLPLFREHEMQPTIPRRKKSDMLQGKIGVNETIYEVLGNSGASLTPSQPNDLFSFDETPIMITFIDDTEKVKAVLTALRVEVKSGFIITNKVEQWK
jgi:PII-like signaling protein